MFIPNKSPIKDLKVDLKKIDDEEMLESIGMQERRITILTEIVQNRHTPKSVLLRVFRLRMEFSENLMSCMAKNPTLCSENHDIVDRMCEDPWMWPAIAASAPMTTEQARTIAVNGNDKAKQGILANTRLSLSSRLEFAQEMIKVGQSVGWDPTVNRNPFTYRSWPEEWLETGSNSTHKFPAVYHLGAALTIIENDQQHREAHVTRLANGDLVEIKRHWRFDGYHGVAVGRKGSYVQVLVENEVVYIGRDYVIPIKV